MIHFDYRPIKGCMHRDLTHGEICVKCGECGRFDKEYKCINCGYTEGKKPLDVYKNWGQIEFLDVFAVPICPNCKSLFKKEDKTQVSPWWKNEGIPCLIKDFEKRKLK